MQARATARSHPTLTASWRWLVAGLMALAGLALAVTARRHGARALARTAPFLALATAAQAGDIYVHLGLHRGYREREMTRDATRCREKDEARASRYRANSSRHFAFQNLFTELGPANGLTAARGLAASWLWARLVAGMPLDDGELALALAAILATDGADGAVARRTGLASALGGYLDAEADLFAWMALTVTQLRRKQIPAWFALIVAMRWLAPTAAGLAHSFAGADPVPLDGMMLGKIAGGAQATAALVALAASVRAEQTEAPLWRHAHTGILSIASALLGVATVAHVKRLCSRK